MNKSPKSRDSITTTWAGVALLTLVFMTISPLRQLLVPLMFLNTHIHELFHAVGAMLTGGVPLRIEIFPDGSGATPVYGGSTLVVGSAGYLGASAFGALLILFSTDEQRSQRALLGTAFAITISLLALVRGNPTGIVSGVAIAVILTVLGNTKGKAPVFAAQFVGLQQCLYSLTSLLQVWQISGFTYGHSDAKILQQATGVPAIAWASLWLVASGAMVLAVFRKVLSG